MLPMLRHQCFQRGDYDAEFSQIGQKDSFDYYGPGWAAAANAPHSYYKTSSSEGGLPVPFVSRFPGKIPADEFLNTFGFVKDIVPTVLEAAGVEIPGTSYKGKTIHLLNGTSMRGVFTSEASTVHDASEAIGYELEGGSALFRGQYKLVRKLPPEGYGGTGAVRHERRSFRGR